MSHSSVTHNNSLFLGIVGLLLIRDTPQERGVYPDNVSEHQYKEEYFTGEVDNNGGWTTKLLLKTKEFWLVAVTTALYQLVTVGIMTQLIVRNIQLGFTEVQAISLMTVLACIGVAGSWGFGVINQKYGTKKSMIVLGIWYVIALIANVTEVSFGVYISLFMIGMAIGGSANFTTSLPAAVFGRHGFDKVNSVIFPVQGLITSMNFLLSGISIALIGSLRGGYVVFIGVILVNLILISRIDEHKYNRDFRKEEVIYYIFKKRGVKK